VNFRGLSVVATTILLAAPIASVRADGPAVSGLNGKLATEAGVTGDNSGSSAVGLVNG